MPKPIIAIDIDDVLSQHAQEFVDFSNKRWGTHLTVEDYHENWSDMWQIDLEETEERARHYFDSGRLFQYRHNETARPVLKKLSKNYRLVILTSRQSFLKDGTVEWLEKNFPNIFTEVHFASFWDLEDLTHAHEATKAEMALGVKASYLIDDQPKHCLGAAEVGIESLLFGDYSWNRSVELPENVTRVHDWQAVGAYFDGK